MTAEHWLLLNWLHRGGQWAYFWTPDGEEYTNRRGELCRSKVSMWYPVGRLCAVPAAWADRNVYWPVHPLTQIPKTNAYGDPRRPHLVRGRLEFIAAINCLFAEFDGGADAALARLEALTYRPSAIVHSGGGLHCYWLLGDTVTVTDANRAQLGHAQAAWVALVGGDGGAKDLDRVLRVPGHRNMKPERRQSDGSYPVVRLLELDFGRLYDLDQLTRLLPAYTPPKPQTAAPLRGSEAAAGRGAIQWAYGHIGEGARHSTALWLARKLCDDGVSELAATMELERFQAAANARGGRQLDAGEMNNIVRWAYGAGGK